MARIGLLGGSFNPAHEGHIHISKQAARTIGMLSVLALGLEAKSPGELRVFLWLELVLPARAGLEGHSLAAQLKEPSAPRTFPAITTQSQNNHAVRTDRLQCGGWALERSQALAAYETKD